MTNPRDKGNYSRSKWRLQSNKETLVSCTQLDVEARKTKRSARHVDEARSPTKTPNIFECPAEHYERWRHAKGHKVGKTIELGTERTLGVCQPCNTPIKAV